MIKKQLNFLLIFGVSVGGFFPLFQKDVDINRDGRVDICDVQQLISAIVSNSDCVLFDINSDGIIDIKDLQILTKNMGKKQKIVNFRNEIFNNVQKPAYGDNQLNKNIVISSFNKRHSQDNVEFIKIYLQRRELESDSCRKKLNGAECIAYHLGAKAPPNS